MQRYFLVILFAMLVSFGCSGRGSNANANADTQVETPVESADANSALAEGKGLLDENQTEAAIAAFQKAVELNPDLAEAYFQLGIAYDLLEMQRLRSGELGDTGTGDKKTRSEKAFEKAVVAYEKWLAKNPKDDVAHFNLGRTFAKLNRDEEAVDSFDEAVELKPDDTEYLTELGAAQIKLARYSDAIKSLERAIEIDETNDRAIEMLEDAKAGRQRVTYKSRPDANEANKAVNSNSKLSDSNTAANSNGAIKTPPANTAPVKQPPPKPAASPKEQPRGRMPNPDTRPRKIN